MSEALRQGLLKQKAQASTKEERIAIDKALKNLDRQVADGI